MQYKKLTVSQKRIRKSRMAYNREIGVLLADNPDMTTAEAKKVMMKKGRKPKGKRPVQQAEGVQFPHHDYVISRGRYRGTKIGDLPSDYLEWCINTHDWGWAKDELARRYGSFDYDE